MPFSSRFLNLNKEERKPQGKNRPPLRSLDEIAEILRISVSTLTFHMATAPIRPPEPVFNIKSPTVSTRTYYNPREFVKWWRVVGPKEAA